MSDEPAHTNGENRPAPTEEQLVAFSKLLCRKPNELEIKLFSNLFSDDWLKQVLNPQNNTYPLTDDLSCVFNNNSAILCPDDEFEFESAKSVVRLFNSVLEKKANPVAIVNSFTIGNSNTENAKHILDKIIKGTGKVSNIAGIPNLNTSLKFNSLDNHQLQIHSCAVGIKDNHKSSSKKVSAKNKIYLFGKFLNGNVKGKKQAFSTYHFKFLKDVLLELFDSAPLTSLQPISNKGITGSLAAISKQLALGVELDISTLLEKTKSNDYEYIFQEQPTAFLIITEKEKPLIEAAAKWELECLQIGKTSSELNLIINNKSEKIIDVPIIRLIEHFSGFQINSSVKEEEIVIKKADIKNIKLPKKINEVAWFLINHPNIASKSCIQQQYDTMVGGSSMNNSFHSDAEILNLKGTKKALGVSIKEKNLNTEGFHKHEVQIAIAELCRKMVCSGAKPLSCHVNLIGTGNSKNLTISTKIDAGINEIASKLKISGSFNNYSTDNENLLAHFAMVGVIEDKNHQMTRSFKDKGNIIFLIGTSSENLSGSEYLSSYIKDKTKYLSDFNANTERKINLVLLDLIAKNLICSAHNVAKGGLFLSLVESAMVFDFGFDIITDTDIRTDAFLFGEAPGRVIVSVTPNKEDRFIDFMMQKELPFLAIGHVTKGEMRVDDISYGFINDAKEEYNNALKRFLNKEF